MLKLIKAIPLRSYLKLIYIPFFSLTLIQAIFSQNILVLPIESNLGKTKQSSIYEEGIRSLLVNAFVFSNRKIVNFKSSQRIAHNIEEKKLNLKQISIFIRNKKIHYVLFSKLKKYKESYELSLYLLDTFAEKIIFKNKNEVFVSKTTSKTGKKEALLFDGKTMLPEVFDLCNPLLKKLFDTINTMDSIHQAKIGARKLEIMFVLDSMDSIKDEIQSLRESLKKVFRYGKSLDEDIQIRVNVLNLNIGFTNDIEKIEDHWDSFSRDSLTRSTKNEIYEKLRKGLMDSGWSDYEQDKKMIILLTPGFKNKFLDFAKDRNKKFFILPINFINISQELQMVVRKKLQLELKMLPSFQDYILENATNIKNGSNEDNGIRYQMGGFLKKVQKKYLLGLKLYDNQKKVFQLEQEISSLNPFNIEWEIFMKQWSQAVESYLSSQNPLSEFFEVGSEMGSQSEQLIQLAKSRQIRMYVLGASGMDRVAEKFLKGMSVKSGGNYQNLSYGYSNYIQGKGNEKSQELDFIYYNKHLYKSLRRLASNLWLDKTALKDIGLGQEFSSFEASWDFLIRNGYPVYKESFRKIKNNLLQVIQGFLKKEFWDSKTKEYGLIWFKSDNYVLPVKVWSFAGFSEYQKLKKWVGRKVFLSGRIFSSLRYNVAYWENNHWVQRQLSFKIEPQSVKILGPRHGQFISKYVQKKVQQINLFPSFYQKYGLELSKRWFIKGEILDAVSSHDEIK